ncbi:MAG: chorismate synthase [Candidatus Thorarchaeota archaeon]|jgi:chorismate synthase
MTFVFGKDFKIQVFGESHGEGIGVVVEGCPPGFEIDQVQIQTELNRRRPGIEPLTSPRAETDIVEIRSGIFKGKTTGAPLMMTIPNIDVDSSSYEAIKDTPRPGHADYTARVKYRGHNDYRGGGVFSGRITAAMVMAGSVAQQLLKKRSIEVLAHVVKIGNEDVKRNLSDDEIISNVYTNPVRCGDNKSAKKMQQVIEGVKDEGDSIGGVVECRIVGIPVGIGEPIFDSVESVISHAMFSIPGVKGIEFGSGFKGATMRGSENNDPPIIVDGKVAWSKNDAGGVLGGITNGAPVVFRVGFKPTSTISKDQRTINLAKMEETQLQARGRHDPCIVPRAVPVVAGLAALVTVDLLKRDAATI